MTDDIETILVMKGRERYIWLYRDDELHVGHLLRSLGRMASDDDLSFSWKDAARVCNLLRGRVESRRTA